jgi:hypothetical protein
MGGENSYIKGMEEQLRLMARKVNKAQVKAPLSSVKQTLEAVNAKFSTLREAKEETFDVHKIEFETTLNELSQMLEDNSKPINPSLA